MNLELDSEVDTGLSPYTGWTREQWVELAEKMIAALQPYVTPGKGGLALPNPVRWQDEYLPEPEKMESFYWMEGYTRTRLLLAAWMVGTGKTILKVNGRTVNILEQFIEGLLSASDPDHPEYIGDRYGNRQFIAETSAVALAIFMARDLVWAKLTPKDQRQITAWIFNTTRREIPHNNWYLFLSNTHGVLKALGEKYDQDEYDHCLEQVKSFYLGSGWFMDGDLKRGYSIDQYNAWGFHHFLPALVLMGSVDSGWQDWIIDCLQQFVTSYARFFGANGAFAMWGRSWAYRPAVTVPFIWTELLGCSPLESGVSRRLVSGQMKYWLEHDYFQDDMTPSMGYAGENLELIEPYSQYGSPYWGSLAFLNLVMPPDHPFWQEKEKPLPVERQSYVVAEKEIGMLVAGNHHTGEVQIVNHRAWHQREGEKTRYAKKYTNFSYSSHFGIDLYRSNCGYNCDNMLSVTPDGKQYSQRIIPYFIRLGERYGASYHYPLTGFPFSEVENSASFSADDNIEAPEDRSVKVTTQTCLIDFCQVRLHVLETERVLLGVREGGFALNYFHNRPEAIVGEHVIAFWNGDRGAFIQNVLGFAGPEKLETLFERTELYHTLGGQSVTPTLVGQNLQPGRHLFISFSGTWFGPKEGYKEKVDLIKHVQVNEDQVVLELRDGAKQIFNL